MEHCRYDQTKLNESNECDYCNNLLIKNAQFRSKQNNNFTATLEMLNRTLK